MKIMGATGQKWLKGFHITFAALWVGSGFSLILMQLFLKASGGGALYGIDLSMKFVDDFIIIPGAFGCLITGLIYSLFTNWGFFKHRWVTIKWIINVGGILFGTFFLGPWLNYLPTLSGPMGLEALADPSYIYNKTMNIIWGPVQVGTLILAVYISVFKPWKKKKGTRGTD